MEQVPNSLIKALVYPRGARLYRKPKKLAAPITGFYRGSTSFGPRRGHWDESQQRFIWDDEYGENTRMPFSSERRYSVTDYAYRHQNALADWEYISWFGPMTKQSSWARCRVCGLIKWGADERALHVKGECRRMLFGALAKLRADLKCVVCNKAGGLFHSLGLPFCSSACLDKYKHDDGDVESQKNFKEALRLVGYKET